jgi:hypothetical protein
MGLFFNLVDYCRHHGLQADFIGTKKALFLLSKEHRHGVDNTSVHHVFLEMHLDIYVYLAVFFSIITLYSNTKMKCFMASDSSFVQMKFMV